MLAEETQPGANGVPASVLFCLDREGGWREWTVNDVCEDLMQLARAGLKPKEIAAHLGLSERTVFRRLAS